MRLAFSFILVATLSASAQRGGSFGGLDDVAFLGSMSSDPSIVFRAIGSNSTTSGATSYSTTAANSASANALVLAVVMNSLGTTATTVNTFTGMGLTWDKIAETNWNNGTIFHRMTVYKSMSGSASTSTTCTADFNGVTQTGCALRVCEFSGVDTSGTRGAGAIVQSAMAGTNAVGTKVGVNLSALSGGGKNAVVMFAGNQVNGFTGAAKAGYTEDWDTGYNTPASGQYLMYAIGTTDNTPLVTATTASIWGAIAFEIKAQ